MLKAWEKAQNFAGKIANFKAWLTKLTHNLCVDIYRESKRNANQVKDIEAIGQESGLICFEDTSLSGLEIEEKTIAIRRAIDNLPIRLRETFILHFDQDFSHQQIVQQQGISYQNVCKRISQARKILREELRKYFIGDSETDTELSLVPELTDSLKEEISQNTAITQCKSESLRCVDVEEVETLIEVTQSEQQSEEHLEGVEETLALGQFAPEFSFWGNSWLYPFRFNVALDLGGFFYNLEAMGCDKNNPSDLTTAYCQEWMERNSVPQRSPP